MTDDEPEHLDDREAIRKRIAAILADMRSGKAPKQDCRKRLQQLSRALRRLELSPEQREWVDFIERLINRQGTHVPDWQAFYRERTELEHRIRERSDDR